MLLRDVDLRVECEVVAHEDARTGREADRERLVRGIPDADTEGYSLGDGRAEIERSEEPGVVLRESVLTLRDRESRVTERLLHRFEHLAVTDGKPGLGRRRGLDRDEFSTFDGTCALVQN